MTEFNDIERQAKQRKESVRASFMESLMLETHMHVVRNEAIEEVARHIEKLTGFGQDTISSFAIYIREMKK
jgi:hypothetical protein